MIQMIKFIIRIELSLVIKSKWIVPQLINSINIGVPMSELTLPDYHFCTLNELQTPKPLPSLPLIAKLLEICRSPLSLFESPLRNIYDRKNHILYINNYPAYARTLKEKYSRTVSSFEKQLKMIGFKKRKIRDHSADTFVGLLQQPNDFLNKPSDSKEEQKKDSQKKKTNNELELNNGVFHSESCRQKELSNPEPKYMFVWRTNRTALIEKQLQSFELALSQQVERAILVKEEIERRKKDLDGKLETIIFHAFLNSQDSYFTEVDTESSHGTLKHTTEKGANTLNKNLNEALQQLKLISNQSQLSSREFVRNISKNSESQIELYRLLVYKQSHIHKCIEEE